MFNIFIDQSLLFLLPFQNFLDSLLILPVLECKTVTWHIIGAYFRLVSVSKWVHIPTHSDFDVHSEFQTKV